MDWRLIGRYAPRHGHHEDDLGDERSYADEPVVQLGAWVGVAVASRGARARPEKKRLDIEVDFPPGSLFPCPECGDACKVHDTKKQTWRHLNFFEHLAYLHGRQPRTKCEKHGVKTTTVPWARAGANFTLLFEAMVVALGRNGLTPTAIGRVVGEHDTLVWRILEHYVNEVRARDSHASTTSVGVDETSRAKGHVYVTLFVAVSYTHLTLPTIYSV